MKKLLLTSAFLTLGVVSMFAQAIVNFNNVASLFPDSSTVDRFVYLDRVGGTKLVGTNWVAELWWGWAADLPEEALTESAKGSGPTVVTPNGGARFRVPTMNLPGTWNGGTRTLVGAASGQTVTMQVRVWSYGTNGTGSTDFGGVRVTNFFTFAEAVASSGIYGKSDPFNYTIPYTGGPPGDYILIGLRAFALTGYPSEPPAITQQPGDQTVTAGTTVTFTVGASGSGILYYQWRKNGVNLSDGGGISGALTATLSLASVQVGAAGGYSAVVTNAYGAVTSRVATLAVVTNTPPTITQQPSGQTVAAGATVTFAVVATGSGTLYYQWRKDEINLSDGAGISGARSAILTLANVQASAAGAYSVVVTNAYGTVTSAAAALTVNCRLTLLAPVGGAVFCRPSATSYPSNSTVHLTAVPVMGCAFTGWTGDASGLVNPLAILMSSNKTIGATFTSTIPAVVVDTPDATFQPRNDWRTGSGGSCYGTDYRSAVADGEGETATFKPQLPASGVYDIDIWYPNAVQATHFASFQVVDGAGTNQLFVVNQTLGFGTWQRLATGARFPMGSAGYVRLVNATVEANREVLADAVRFVWSPQQDYLQPFVKDIIRTGNTATLEWYAVSNRIYRVFYKARLDSSVWSVLVGDVLANRATATKLDNTLGSASQRFYRVMLLP